MLEAMHLSTAGASSRFSAPDTISQDVVRFSRFEGTEQTMDVFLAEFDVLTRKAEAKKPTGAASPEQFAPVIRAQNAALYRFEKSLISATVQGNAAFPLVAQQMRRFFGTCRGTARYDVLVAADTDASPEEEAIYEA